MFPVGAGGSGRAGIASREDDQWFFEKSGTEDASADATGSIAKMLTSFSCLCLVCKVAWRGEGFE